VTTGDPVVVGAGDIATTGAGDAATAALLDTIAGTVITMGDNSNGTGSAQEFAADYAPTWGRHKARTRPVPGNHDYKTAGAAGYFDYFGPFAGTPGNGWYSYDLGAWHIVALNSNVAHEVGSAQERWLRADLAASTKTCTLAYWHRPRFTSGARHAPDPGMDPLFRALYDHGVEIVLSGHNHQYERFAPQDPDGQSDPRGVRQFVVGTGGTSHYPFATPQPNSEVRNGDTFGVLRLRLTPNGYDWRFVPEAGKTFTDSGATACH
jgi:3',5'-cyclic AMP phosphodiesterase CpdA